MEEDFEEEEVWAMVRESRDDHSPKDRKPKGLCRFSAPRKMLRSNGLGEESSSASLLRQSAPVNIPDWSKVYKQSMSLNAAGGEQVDGAGLLVMEEKDDEEEEDRVPPHEWIARKLARSQISSSSVCEGAGRTLKGRDQRRVRNAVLTRTGFLE